MEAVQIPELAAPSALTLRALAALLSYPESGMRAHLSEVRAALREEGALGPAHLAGLEGLIEALEKGDPLETEAAYVDLFDRGRSTSLHLFEHVYGDSRDRGPAMVDLAQTYEQGGLLLGPGELPDYLPVVLEFASTRPAPEARAFLGEMAHILNALFQTLQRRESAYASALGALLELAGEPARPVPEVPEEPLDASWDEPPVFDGCASRGQSRPGQPQTVHFVRNHPSSGAVA
jgi:nitrate reductase delta subunit